MMGARPLAGLVLFLVLAGYGIMLLMGSGYVCEEMKNKSLYSFAMVHNTHKLLHNTQKHFRSSNEKYNIYASNNVSPSNIFHVSPSLYTFAMVYYNTTLTNTYTTPTNTSSFLMRNTISILRITYLSLTSSISNVCE